MSELEEWKEVRGQAVNLSELDDMVKALKAARDIHAEKKAIATEAYVAVQEIENKVLKILMDSGKSKYFVDGIGTVYTINKYVVRCPKTLEALRAMRDYVVTKYGQDAADQMFTVNHQTLNSFFNKEKEAVEDPAFTLPGVESPTLEQSVGLRNK